MKNITTFLLFVFLTGLFISESIAQDGIEIIQSEYSVDETTDRLEKVLKENGLNIFKKVNHSKGAASLN